MPPRAPQKIADRFDQAVFDAICSRALVYNACWEDPAVDRLALGIGPEDTMLVITSAGCNVLDYALTGPRRIHSVDANPRQNALLELKLAGIRRLEFEDFFAAFGRGYHPGFGDIYREALRADLSPFAQHFWDRRVDWCGPASCDGRPRTPASSFAALARHRPISNGSSSGRSARS